VTTTQKTAHLRLLEDLWNKELSHPRPDAAVVRDLLQYRTAGPIQSPALSKSFRHQSSFPCDIPPSEDIDCSALALKTFSTRIASTHSGLVAGLLQKRKTLKGCSVEHHVGRGPSLYWLLRWRSGLEANDRQISTNSGSSRWSAQALRRSIASAYSLAGIWNTQDCFTTSPKMF